MKMSLSRSELIVIVEKIMQAEGTEEELDRLINLLERNVPHPEVSDLIFWNDKELSPEEVVDEALSYQSIMLPD
ncbi:bacteriocin immunity protein [Paenibacillus sp. GCM10027626]|uniref:bacteriocin immunity protein n=1 Tax=Paenibacillus sp. GCM10027626 TaxID=3273411 RepID=UPI0036407E17